MFKSPSIAKSRVTADKLIMRMSFIQKESNLIEMEDRDMKNANSGKTMNELIVTITEIENKYEHFKGFETRGSNDEEIRLTLIGIRNKLNDLQNILFNISLYKKQIISQEMPGISEESIEGGMEVFQQIINECKTANSWIKITMAVNKDLTSPQTVSSLNVLSGLDNLVTKLRLIKGIFEKNV